MGVEQKSDPLLEGVLLHPEGPEMGWMAWKITDAKQSPGKTALINLVQEIVEQSKDEGFQLAQLDKPRGNKT